MLMRLDRARVIAAEGLTLESWLRAVAGRTGADAGMLLVAAERLVDMPATLVAFRAGVLSWARHARSQPDAPGVHQRRHRLICSLRASSRMLAGISTRRYPVALDPVGAQVEQMASSMSKSAVLRRLVNATAERLADLHARLLGWYADYSRPKPTVAHAATT